MSEVNTETTQETTQVEQGAAEAQAEKMVPQSQLNAIIDKKFAKIASQHKEELARVREEALTEGQKLAKMNAEERAKHDLEAKLAELNEREANLTKGELKSQAKSLLVEKGMPIELADYLPFVDAENTMSMLDTLEKGFRIAVEKAVTERLKGSAPKINSNVTQVSEKDKLIAQYNEAEKKGDVLRMLTLEAQIKKLKE